MPDVTFGPHYDDFVEAQVRSGRYQDASEVVRAALRLLEREGFGDLATVINQAFDETGPDIPVEEVFAVIEQRHAAAKANAGA